jgi:mRNA-degrading endonuclease RelE of RelBE toxin-antitoxin system
VTIILVVGQDRGFALAFAPEVVAHLDTIERKLHSGIRKQIRLRLSSEPEKETRNRKPLDVPAVFGAQWELRFGPGNRFRVFYEVDAEARTVTILAIGVKDRNVLRIGAEEHRT